MSLCSTRFGSAQNVIYLHFYTVITVACIDIIADATTAVVIVVVIIIIIVVVVVVVIIGTLRKTRRQRQRERHQTKGLISRTIAVHVRYNSWYISLPSSAKQRREMTKFCVAWRTWTTTANFSYFSLELNAFVAYSAEAGFNSNKHTE